MLGCCEILIAIEEIVYQCVRRIDTVLERPAKIRQSLLFFLLVEHFEDNRDVLL